MGTFVRTSNGFEPVLDFLHQVPGEVGDRRRMVKVAHETGTFQATSGHLVFTAESDKPMSKVVVGDSLLVGDKWQKVTGVSVIESSSGLYAPLTPSGTIVVEGVLASNYATPSPSLWLPHAAAHAAFFSLRALHELGLGPEPRRDESFRCPDAENIPPGHVAEGLYLR